MNGRNKSPRMPVANLVARMVLNGLPDLRDDLIMVDISVYQQYITTNNILTIYPWIVW